MKKKSAIIVAIILMSIGFALVSTTLIINGSTKLSENQDDFEIIFTAADLDGTNVYSTAVDETKKKITFTTSELKTLNQTSILTYEVTNNSSNYDANVRVTCVPRDGTTAKYTSIKNKLENGATMVKAKEKINGTLTITLDKVSVDEVIEEYTCRLAFDAIERTNNAAQINQPAKPVLVDGLIPVTITDGGTVTYADTSKEWYNYEKKVWANSVILNDGVNYKVGDVIKESDIQSYFVWIPRFKYKLFNVDNYAITTVSSSSNVVSKAQEIELEFETKDTKISNGSKNGEWLTHPAFTSFDINGFWTGKFETSSNYGKVTIKPNKYSWTNISIKNIFETSYKYKREADSHMMKNTEWGAVAYLSNSKYGQNAKININNNSSFKTGYSALPSTDQSSVLGSYGDSSSYNRAYNTSVGYLASTTGNISGIYDMSGGAYEYVASYVDGKTGSSELNPQSYSSKYFDVYNASSSIFSYKYRILGDATGEMGPFFNFKEKNGSVYPHCSWYSDLARFVDSSNPWFFRGGAHHNGVIASQFSFARDNGASNSYVSFRIVLAP